MISKAIAITYVPNTFCNLGCKYCYLGTQTDIKTKGMHEITTNLKKILDEYIENGIVVEMIMLHGAEITTVPEIYLRELFEYINEYNKKYSLEIATFGSRKPPIHIKTNLFNFDKLQPLFEEFAVSISGSFDLPFSLHSKFRVDKKGRDTLPKILGNIELLKDYKFAKGISCVFTREAFENMDEWIRDLRYMHEELGFDMIENFYIMFAYDSKASESKFDGRFKGTSMLSQEELVLVYQKLKKEFAGTDYERGLNFNWFKEFLPGYCTFEDNCGESNFLYQKNGDVYPCHRTQPDKDFKYGNIFKDGLKKIIESGFKTIEKIENDLEIDEDCYSCDYFKYCKLNCTLVRKETSFYKSYTCSLQKEIYKDQPERFPVNKRESSLMLSDFVKNNNYKILLNKSVPVTPSLTEELEDKKYSIRELIQEDPELESMYAHDNFTLMINDEPIFIASPILNPFYRAYEIKSDYKIYLRVKKEIFDVNCKPANLQSNTLLAMCLSDNKVVYGDEQRTKQEHLFDETVYFNTLFQESYEDGDFVVYDISDIIHKNAHRYTDGVLNNMFFTTRYARDYHYQKQSKNAFYHIQAVNLPFHNFMFEYKK